MPRRPDPAGRAPTGRDRGSRLSLVLWPLLLWLAGTPAIALPPEAPNWALTQRAAFWFDPSGRADLESARTAPFRPAATPNFGNRRGALWVRLVIENPAEPLARLLAVGPPMLERVGLWQPAAPGAGYQAGGLAVPMTARPWPGRVSLFPLTLPSGTTTLYLRLASPSKLTPVIGLWQATAWEWDARAAEIRTALMFGALLMIVQMALVYALRMREWVWAVFALSILSYVLYQACYEGFAGLWLWPGRPDLSLVVLPVAAALTQGLLAVFLLRFVPLDRVSRGWRFLWGLPLTTVLALILVFAVDYRYGMPLMEGVGLLCSIALPLFSLAAWRRGFRPARYALASFGLIYAATALRVGMLFGWWSGAQLADQWLMPLSGVLAASLLMLALMEQLRDLRAAQLVSLAELAEARDGAHRANRAKGLFLARVSHDLRTPLQTLTGYLDLAAREGPTGTLRRYLEAIGNSGRTMLALIEELLQFARGEEGRLELNPKPTFLHALIETLAAEAEVLAGWHGNRFVVDLDLGVSVATLDGERLHAVLMNLLSNACRMTQRGTVTLSVAGRAAGGTAELRFTVADTGPGIPAEDQERIFLPFEQGRGGGQSSGLGLAIARQLVRLMGSDLLLDSRPGAGATFTFVLRVPVAEEAEVLPSATFSAPFGYEGRVRTLLVVDDVAENRTFMQDLLTGMGFDVVLAVGVAEALAQPRDCPLDGAIVDQYLDDGDGWQVLDGLKARHPNLPVILLSATPARPPPHRRSPWAFDAHLLKPLHIDEFTRVLGGRLLLTWRTERTAPLPPPAATLPPARPMTRADLLVLRQAAHEGSLFEVEDWIERWQQRPEEQGFLDQLAPLLAATRLSAVVGLVDERLGGAPAP